MGPMILWVAPPGVMLAQCVIPGFARVLSEAAYSYQVAVHKAGLAVKRLSRLGDVSEAEAMSVFEAMCAHEPEAQAAEMAEEWAMKAEVPLPSSWMGDFGVHGTASQCEVPRCEPARLSLCYLQCGDRQGEKGTRVSVGTYA